MIRSVAWGVDALDCPIVTANYVTVFHEMVRLKIHIAALFYLHPLFHFARTMRSIGVGRRARFCLQQAAAR